jgi:hypothetical protein
VGLSRRPYLPTCFSSKARFLVEKRGGHAVRVIEPERKSDAVKPVVEFAIQGLGEAGGSRGPGD